MNGLKRFVNIFFSSYTIASLVVAIFNYSYYTNGIGIEWVFQMALLCFVISFLMFITGIISEKISNPIPQWLYILIGIIEVSACVILMGGLWYQWFPMSIKWILEIIVIDLIIYFAVYGITFFQEKQFANNINKIIKNRRKSNGKDNRS